MSRLRDRRFRPDNPYARKADQQWELAGCARTDGDRQAEQSHTDKAREYEQLARDWEGSP